MIDEAPRRPRARGRRRRRANARWLRRASPYRRSRPLVLAETTDSCRPCARRRDGPKRLGTNSRRLGDDACRPRGQSFPAERVCGAWAAACARRRAPTTSARRCRRTWATVRYCSLLESSSLVCGSAAWRRLPDSQRRRRRCTGARAASASWSVLLRPARTRSGARRSAAEGRRSHQSGRRRPTLCLRRRRLVTPRASPVRSRASTATSRSAASAAERLSVLCRVCGGNRAAAASAAEQGIARAARPVHGLLDPSTYPWNVITNLVNVWVLSKYTQQVRWLSVGRQRGQCGRVGRIGIDVQDAGEVGPMLWIGFDSGGCMDRREDRW